MGDLVPTEDEKVAPVMKTLQDGGVEIAALDNHLLGESPKIMYLHIGGHGDPVQMAHAVGQDASSSGWRRKGNHGSWIRCRRCGEHHGSPGQRERRRAAMRLAKALRSALDETNSAK
jgi:uncharacterized protein DUF1259